MSTKKYWKGIEELNNTPEFQQHQQNEFVEDLNVVEFLSGDKLDKTSTNRRDFLKFLGFSTVAATLASCETPVKKSIPYVTKPESITPGVANYYASTFYDGYDFCSVLVKTREGRPIKIEGNDRCPITKGGTSARVQGSVLGLYDTKRYQVPTLSGKATDWNTLDTQVTQALANAAGKPIYIVSPTIISPTTKKVIAAFSEKYPTTKLIQYDALSFTAMIAANEATMGKANIPSYNLENAELIVSIGADFLAHWLSPIELSVQYAKVRKVSRENPTMSRHIQIETQLSLTGSNADLRIPVKPSQLGLAALGLLKAVQGQASSYIPGKDTKIDAIAAELLAAKGKAVVVCGVNDVNVQIVVNQINQAIGSYGTTIDFNIPLYTKQGTAEEVKELIANTSNAGAIIFYGANPVYTLPEGDKFAKAIANIPTIAIEVNPTETSSLCKFIAPDHHYLESWNDFLPKKGVLTLAQPTIQPLFQSRQGQSSLLKWAGINEDYYTYLQANSPVAASWNKAIYDGVVSTEIENKATTERKADKIATQEPEKALTAILPTTTKTSNTGNAEVAIIAAAAAAKGMEVFVYEKVGIGVGNQTANPFLQELPDPISKVTWDNYITMNPQDMLTKGFNTIIGQESPADLVELTVGAKKMKLPVFAQPGQPKGTFGVALGYGKKQGINKGITDNGANAFVLTQLLDGHTTYSAAGVSMSASLGTYPLAATQTHHTLMGRDMVKETTLEEYKVNKKAANPDILITTNLKRIDEKDGIVDGKGKPANINMWQDFQHKNHFWNMSIDLNSCIGCGACVIACNIENNVAVVGKDEVRRSREMHWMRIDRYYSSDTHSEELEQAKGPMATKDALHRMEIPSNEDTLEVVFQPMMCQHCNHAPCETVCPVLATTHSLEGLNMMTYNRCIGTRYCANNCPYKVRRFNWFNYHGNDKFKDFNMAQWDEVARMVLNPDVTVRSRGVMEKCSMCVQRLQEGKLNAKKENRRPIDGDIKVACQQSCPTQAITFGDWNDKQSKIYEASTNERMYYMLDEVGVQPSVYYQTKIRHKAPAKGAVDKARKEGAAYEKSKIDGARIIEERKQHAASGHGGAHAAETPANKGAAHTTEPHSGH